MGCPAVIKFRSSKDGEKLVITEMNKNHTHEVSEVIEMNYLPNKVNSFPNKIWFIL